MTLACDLDTLFNTTDTSPQVPKLISLNSQDWWRESAETEGSPYMDAGADLIDQAFAREAFAVPGVEEIRRQDLQDPLGIVYWVYVNNLSSDSLSALVHVSVAMLDRFPGQYIDIEVRDRFDAPRLQNPQRERMPVVQRTYHGHSASQAGYCQ